MLTVAPRLAGSLLPEHASLPALADIWGEAAIVLPPNLPGRFVNLITRESVDAIDIDGRPRAACRRSAAHLSGGRACRQLNDTERMMGRLKPMDETSPLLVAPGIARRLAIGAELISPTLTSFRVWAPDHETVRLVVDDVTHDLRPDGDGYFRADVAAGAGSRYGFLLGDHDERLYPDPASRFQPDGPHGLSEVVDPGAYRWRDVTWPGVRLRGQVIYELHIGTFTRAGTWRAAIAHLGQLRDLGVTLLQVMPISDFPGAFGWGYDGVNWFAPTRIYGDPDDCRRFVDEAHATGLGVLLDVVYNHLGSERELSRALRARLLHRSPSDRLGPRHQLRWPACGARPGAGAGQRRALGARVPLRWVSPRRDPCHPGRIGGACAGCARGAGAGGRERA